jgi:hypothetical protein
VGFDPSSPSLLFVSNNGADTRGSRPIVNDWDDMFIIHLGQGVQFFGWPDYFHDPATRQPLPVTNTMFCPPSPPYGVFILEFAENFQQLSYRRGSSGGSNEPFTIHLFTGGLLLESLLKHYYPKAAGHQGTYTIGTVFHRADCRADFGLAQVPETSAETLREIYDAIQGSDSVETAFSTAAKLRNTTGHNLVWDNVFDTPEIYVALFDQVMNAVLYVVDAKGR